MAEGLQPDYPDIGLDLARGGYHGFRCELKRRKGGTVRPGQKVWGEHLADVGYYVCIAFGWEDARVHLLAYLELPAS